MSGVKDPIGWLKGVLANKNDEEDHEQNEQNEPIANESANDEVVTVPTNDSPNYNNIFSRENQDKITLDLVVSVENILNDRQIQIFKNKGLTEQLFNANETVTRLKYDINKKEQLILDREREIRQLEETLTDKQMGYDQLIEDYKEYQKNSNLSLDQLKYQLEKENTKYTKLDEEFTKYQYQSMQNVKELEEKIRDLEAENKKLNDQYHRIYDEKAQLLHTINDFTARMSISFAPSDKSKNDTNS